MNHFCGVFTYKFRHQHESFVIKPNYFGSENIF